jgi:hypothetical protein
MNGIPIDGGINDCRWNIDGICTSYDVTRAKRNPHYSRDWHSKINCTITQLGVHICSAYLPEGKYP